MSKDSIRRPTCWTVVVPPPTARGLDVVLHHATFESMDLGRRYRSIYLAGATFNLLPDDASAQLALERIAAHLEPGGSALIPLFIPDPPAAEQTATVREATDDAGRLMRATVLSITHEPATRTQVTHLRYELIDGQHVQSLDRQWLLHWFDQQQFATMAARAGLTVKAVYAVRRIAGGRRRLGLLVLVAPR